MPQETRPDVPAEERARLVQLFDDAFQQRGGALVALKEILSGARPEDVAESLSFLEPMQRLAIYRALPEDERDVLVEEADALVTTQLLTDLETTELVDLVEEMSPDDAADVVLQLPQALRSQVLREVEKSDPDQAEDIRELLEFPPDSAGGLMTPEFVRVSEGATAGSALSAIQGAQYAETITTVFVTDLEDKLVGVVSIRDLLSHKPEVPVADFMERETITARVDDDQEQAAGLLQRYNLSVLPIVDGEGAMRGIITVDDVMDALQEEYDEDIFLLAGVAEPELLAESIWQKGRKRLPWLLVTLVLGVLLAFLLSNWEQVLARNAQLAFFLPVLAGLAGNASIQASTLMVRSLNNEDIDFSGVGRVVLAELRVGFVIGVICGTLICLGATLLGGGRLGLVVGGSMLVAITNATVLGTFVPLALSRFDIDPALSSGPFITTLNDVVSLVIYLSLATALLP